MKETQIVDKMVNEIKDIPFNEVEKFIMAEVAADFLRGIRWVIIYESSPTYKKKLEMLKAAVQQLNLQKQIIFAKVPGGVLVELDYKLIVDTLTKMSGKLPGITVKEDIESAQKFYKEAKDSFIKYIKSLKKGKTNVKIGLYSLNTVDKSVMTVDKQSVAVKAYRLSLSDLRQIKSELTMDNISIVWSNTLEIAPSKNCILVDLQISR